MGFSFTPQKSARNQIPFWQIVQKSILCRAVFADGLNLKMEVLCCYPQLNKEL